MTTNYKNLQIITTKQGRDYAWKITGIVEPNGDKLEDAESGEEFIDEEDAINDAKVFIDLYSNPE